MAFSDPSFEQRRTQLLKGASITPASVGGFNPGTATGGFIDQSFQQRRQQIYSQPTPPPVKVSATPTPAPKTPDFLQNVENTGQSVLSSIGHFAEQTQKNIQGLFAPLGSKPVPITSPISKNITVPELTPDQIKAIGTLKVGQKIPDFTSSISEPSASLKPGAAQGNIIDNIFNKPADYLLNNTGVVGTSIKKFASDIYNNPVEMLVPTVKNIEQSNPVIAAKIKENPIYKFETSALQGVMQGALRVYANWNPRVENFLDQQIKLTGKSGDAAIAGNTVGNIIGTIGSFVAGGEIVSALKFGKAALPATFAVLGQTSLPASTPIEARARNLIVDTVSGTLLEYIKPLANLEKMGMFEKGAEYTKQLAKSMSVLSAQTYLDARSVGANNQQALDMVKSSMLILLGLHGFMIAGKAGEYVTRSQFKEGTAVFTPDQARSAVVGTNLENTDLGKEIMKASVVADSQGKSLRIDMTAAQKSPIAGVLNLMTPNGIKITNIELVDPNFQPKVGPGEVTPESAGKTGITPPLSPTEGGTGIQPQEGVKPTVGEGIVKVPETFKSPVEEKAFTALTSNPVKMVSDYEKSFSNEVSPDLAATMLPDYKGSNATELSRPAGIIKKLVYNDLLKTQQGMNNNTVLITAGGSGSGKTTGQSGNELKNKYSIVVDTTFSANSAPKDIKKALDNHYQVHIAYTFRDPLQAWEDGALKRINEEGRVVPEGYFLQSHLDAQKNIIKVYNKYKDNPDVTFNFYNNTSGRGLQEISFDNVEKHLYNTKQLATEIIAATNKEYEEGRITETQFKAATQDRSRLEQGLSGVVSGGTQKKVPGILSGEIITTPTTFYRGGPQSAMPKGLTAKEIIQYEATELGNEIMVNNGIDLSQVKSKNLQWLTTTKEAAKEYGSVSEVVLDNFRAIAHDNYGGVLVEENPKIVHPPVELSKTQEPIVPAHAGGGVEHFTIAPTEEVKPEKIIAEAQKLGLPPQVIRTMVYQPSTGLHNVPVGYARPKIGKAEFRTFVQNSDEFKANPILTVNENKDLVYNGEKFHFVLHPDQLQISTANLNPGDVVTVDVNKLGGREQQMRIRNNKGEVMGYNPKTETAPEGEIKIPDVGVKAETNQTFVERLGKDPFVLARHAGGSVRDVYDLGNYVAKVANSPRGLEQNDSEGDYGVQGLIPDIVERGKDYVIVQKAQKDPVAARKFLAPLQGFSVTDFDHKTSALQDTMETMGLTDFLNYDLLWNDFIAPRNWGFINGQPVLTDAGALNKNITATSVPSEYATRDWRNILQERKDALRKIRTTGKYPAAIYKAYNTSISGNFTAAQIDQMPLGEIKQWASDGLPGGAKQFDELMNPPEKATGDLGFNPKNLENPFSETAVKETDKIVKQSEIAKTLSEKLGVPIRRGKFRHGSAIGIYKPGQKVVRIKKGGLNTIFHEVAHYLDDTIGFSGDIPVDERKALMEEYGYSYEGQPGKQKKEAFAEYMRFKMTGQNEKIKEWAPKFDKIFNEKIKTMPDVESVINTASEDYKRWNEQPVTSKILSHLSIGGQDKAAFKDRAIQTLHDLYTSGLDDLHPLSEFAKLATKKVGVIDAKEDPYILARNLRGWVGKAELFLNDGTFRKDFWFTDKNGKTKMNFTGKSYSEIMKPVEQKKALDDFRVYIVAQRVVNDLVPRKIVSGISLSDAKKAIEELDKKHPEFAGIAAERRAYKDRLLEYAKDNGVIGEEGLKKIRELNQFHVPFYRVMEESGAKFLGKTKIAGNIGNPIKKIRGSELEIIDPLESDVKDTYAIINAAERNNIGIAMANIASQNFELGRLFEEVAKPMKPVTVNVKEVMDKAMKDVLGAEGGQTPEIPEELADAVVTLFRTTYATGPNMLNVNMGDKQKVFEVDPDLFQAIQGLNIEDVGLIMKILSAPAKLLRAGATLSPDFSVRNPFRDQFTAFVYSKYGFIPGVDLVRGMFELFKKGDTYHLWKAGGGEHAMFVSLDRTKLQENLKQVLGSEKETIIDYVKNPLKILQVISEIGEAGTRLGEMRNALARGANPIEAAYASRNVTLDFSRIGAKTRAINAIIAFFNANIQGTDTMIRNFKSRPFQTLWKVLIGLTLPSVLLYLANRKDPRWKEIPAWQKDLFWIIMTPNHIWRIPKPFELGVLFGSVPERILEVIDSKDPSLFNELESTIANGFTPGFLPTALIPIIENITNYSFFLNRPIVSPGKEALPPGQQAGTYTTEVSKILGEAIGYSPAKIDNLISGYSGGLGKYAVSALDQVLKGTGISKVPPQPALKLEDLPVIKAYMIRPPIGTGSESVNRVYTMYQATNAQLTYVKQLVKEGEVQKAKDYVKANPDTLNALILTGVVSTFSDLNKAVDMVRQSKTMTPEDKTKKMDQIQTIQTQVAEKVLEQLKQNNGK